MTLPEASLTRPKMGKYKGYSVTQRLLDFILLIEVLRSRRKELRNSEIVDVDNQVNGHDGRWMGESNLILIEKWQFRAANQCL